MTPDEFKEIQEMLGFTIEQMAKFCDRSVIGIKKWRSGERKIDSLTADGIRYRIEHLN